MRRHLFALGLVGVVLGPAASASAQTSGGGGIIGSGAGIGSGQTIGSSSGRGGTSSGSFSGGQGTTNASFSGGQGTGGQSFGGGQGGQGGGFGGAGRTGQVVVPTAINPFASYYVNPMARGLVTATTSGGRTGTATTFSQPLYATTTTTNIGTANVSGTTTNQAFGFSTLNMRKTPAYVTALSPDFPLGASLAPGKLHSELTDVLQGSSVLQDLKERGDIGDLNIAVEGGAVVVRGQVATDRQRRLIEGMIRLTPGVREVRNELTPRASPPPEQE